ncbi:glycoside hydrolase family 31 protein [Mobilicoccus massiliensis]|uniref:glycoside hydrolase family 31 protein n=1 Tax=Mobilicoccus massiliensis TaxID=1522310 RepID=UPI00058BEF88|nr:TIM-barrel domain-containing protein [Mobilicoccus massiliensis]
MRICRRVIAVEGAGAWTRIRTDGVEVRVVFVTDDVVRLRAGFDGDFEEASYSLVTTAWEDRLDAVLGDERVRVEPMPVEVEDAGDVVRLRGRRLTVEVLRDPFVLRVLDVDGTVLHEDVAGLGWREDLNARRLHTHRFTPGDRFYGFGEKTGPLDKAGHLLTMSPSDAMGYDPDRTDSLYKHIPFFVRLGGESRVAVGYFYHGTYECEFDLGRSRSNYWPPHVTHRSDGGDIDLFVIAGPRIRDVVRRYTGLTGRPVMLPRAALGYLGSSMYYPELPAACDEAVLGFVDTARAYDMPIDGFQLSSGYTQQETEAGLKRCVFTWNHERFPDPAGFFAAMSERGITVSPNVKPGVLLVHPDVEEMRRAGLFIRRADADDPVVGTWWGGPGHFVDFTDPVARTEWARRLTAHVLEMGTASVWNDNCEYDSIVDLDARCSFDGRGGTVARLRTVMADLMCRVTHEAIRARGDDRRPFVVCRAGHAGIQRYAQTWSGDNATSWESLRGNIATMLGMSLSGVANNGSDIGGFHGPAPGPELFVRWVQHGVFQPRFSIHSVNVDNTVTEPWMYSAQTDRIRRAIDLRYALMPYLYSLMARAHRTGLPIVEPMCSAFQHDPVCDTEGVDFMLGDALLVANVVEPGAATRRVYLPAGEEFVDLWTRRPYPGGEVVELPVDLDSIPVFLRAGGIVPMAGGGADGADEQTLRLVCAPGCDGDFELYEDDGVSLEHERGVSLLTRIAMRTADDETILTFTGEGPFESPFTRVLLDVVATQRAPLWVSVDGDPLPHLLDRRAFERCERGWYYSQTRRSALVRYPRPRGDHRVALSFRPFDMIGM